MTDRKTASTITDTELDALYERLAKAEQETTATATAAAHLTSLVLDRAERAEARLQHLQASSEAAGTLLTRTVDERDQLRAAIARVRALADDLERGGWTGPAIARRIRSLLHEQPAPAATQATDLNEQVQAAIESEIYEYRERTMFWPETGGVTQEIARLATRGAMEVCDRHVAQLRQRLELTDSIEGERDEPSVAECAETDRHYWDVEKSGE